MTQANEQALREALELYQKDHNLSPRIHGVKGIDGGCVCFACERAEAALATQQSSGPSGNAQSLGSNVSADSKTATQREPTSDEAPKRNLVAEPRQAGETSAPPPPTNLEYLDHLINLRSLPVTVRSWLTWAYKQVELHTRLAEPATPKQEIAAAPRQLSELALRIAAGLMGQNMLDVPINEAAPVILNALLRPALTGAKDCCLACGGTGRSQPAPEKGHDEGIFLDPDEHIDR